MLKFVDKNGKVIMEEKDNGELKIFSEKLEVSFKEKELENGVEEDGNRENSK